MMMMTPCKRKPYFDVQNLQLRCTPAKKSKKNPYDGRQFSKFVYQIFRSLDFYKKSKKAGVNFFDDLPYDLLRLIIERLQSSVGDLIRISAVCKSWQIIADSVRHEQQQKQQAGPLLLFHPVTKDRDHTIYHLFDFYKNRTKQIIVPVVSTTRYLSILKSSNEWILKCTGTGASDNFRLLNLLSKEEIEIPCINRVAKVIISATTPLDPNCNFMAIFGEEKKLAFYNKQGGENSKNWNMLINSEFGQGYVDIVYLNGEFHAIDGHGNLVVLRDINKNPKISKVVPSVKTSKSDLLYLVESCGDLFLIVRTRLNTDDSRRKCEAYKLNSGRGIWEKVNSLGDGNSAFFIGYNVSVSVSAKDFPVKRNCIYYTGFIFDGKIDRRDVFNLSTNKFESNLLFS